MPTVLDAKNVDGNAIVLANEIIQFGSDGQWQFPLM